MAKAAKSLTVSSSVLNRRALLRDGSLAAATAAACGSASATTVLTTQPTASGCAYLAAIAKYKMLPWDTGNLSDGDASDAGDQLYSVIDPLTEKINEAKVTSLSQIVDMAIVAASHLNDGNNIEAKDMLPLVRAVCALAGLKADDHIV
jgi:hypothetical protein